MAEFTPHFNTLVEIYRASLSQFGSRPLFGNKQGGEWVWSTYADFGSSVDRFRGGLASLGVTKGDRVAVIANNRAEWAIGAYAAYGLGASYVPMYEAQLDKEWRYILHDCGAKAVIVATKEISKRITGIWDELPQLKQVICMEGDAGGGGVSFDAVLKLGEDNRAPLLDPDPSDVAGFIYTSGTTGNPKGVLLSHKNLANNVSAMHEVFPFERNDRSLSFLPWAHSFGQVVELHGLFSMGASLAIAESVDKIVANLAEVQPTLIFSVPRIFNRIYERVQAKMAEGSAVKKALFAATMSNASARRDLADKGQSSVILDLKYAVLDKLVSSKVRALFGGQLKYAFSGGAAIAKEVAEFIDNLGIVVYEGYGLTETSPIATANWPGSRKIGSVGRAIPGVKVEIDENSEVIVHGHNVMLGYHNLPAENDAVFTKDRGFRTGDMGHLDDDGFLYITGRIKDQYKLENGKYVAPVPVEEQLKLSPMITNVMVYGDNKPHNVAVIVPDMEALKKWAGENGVATTDTNALLADEGVRKFMQGQVDQYSASIKGFEKVRGFVLTAEDFSTANDQLTPSMKLKRRVVFKAYEKPLLALYAKG